MDWSADGPTWPNCSHSRFVNVRPHRWHVQVAGDGPTILLLHGAGGATQTWRDVLPFLAEDHQVIAPDLPGQGFTRLGTRQRCGLKPMAEDIAALCLDQGWQPDLIVGHSAGGALALELAPRLNARGVVGINAALENFEGVAGWLFPMMARVMAMNPMVPAFVARIAGTERRVADLIGSTGSKIDAAGLGLYRRLVADRAHVDGTLAMMSQWDVDLLAEHLASLDLPVLFLVGDRDGTVPARVSHDAARRMPNASVRVFPDCGHLLHEEEPRAIAKAVSDFLASLATDPE